jgi:hypothetical protein
MTTCQPNTVKASCSLLAIGNAKLLGMGVTKERDDNLPAKYSQGFLQLLAMGNTQLARHERHERWDGHFLVLFKAFWIRQGMDYAQSYSSFIQRSGHGRYTLARHRNQKLQIYAHSLSLVKSTCSRLGMSYEHCDRHGRYEEYKLPLPSLVIVLAEG